MIFTFTDLSPIFEDFVGKIYVRCLNCRRYASVMRIPVPADEEEILSEGGS